MHVSFNPNIQQQNFTAVNEKFLKEAKWQIKMCNEVSSDLIERIGMEVVFAEKMTPQDAIDTLNEIKKLLGRTTLGIEQELRYMKNYTPPPPIKPLSQRFSQMLQSLWRRCSHLK